MNGEPKTSSYRSGPLASTAMPPERKTSRFATVLAKLSNPSSKIEKFFRVPGSDPDFILGIVQNDTKRNLLSYNDLSSALLIICYTYYGKPSDIQLLIGSGADVNVQRDVGLSNIEKLCDCTPLDALAFNPNFNRCKGQAQGVEALLKAGANPNACSVMVLAAKRHNHELTSVLLRGGANPNQRGYLYTVGRDKVDPLTAAILHCLPSDPNESEAGKFIDLLLTHGADITAGGTHIPLRRAVEGRKGWICQKLLKAGADPNAGSPLQVAVSNKDIEICKLFLQAGADPNPPLQIAVQKSDAEMCRVLIAAGADVHAQVRGDLCAPERVFSSPSLFRGPREAATILELAEGYVKFYESRERSSLRRATQVHQLLLDHIATSSK